MGLPFPCGDGLGGRDNRLPEVDRRDERAARHSTESLDKSFAVEWRAWSLAQEAFYSAVPEGWSRFEVPWGFCGQAPVACMLWGLRISEEPYTTAAAEGLLSYWGDALWSAAHAQYAQRVAGHLLTEAAMCARLWWLPEPLIEGMLQIGCDTLTCGCTDRASRLTALLESIRLVRWDLVDLSPCTRPSANLFYGPIYEPGNFVSWDAERWEINVCRRLLIPAEKYGLLVGDVALRGTLLTGDLLACLYPRKCGAVRPAHFVGVCDSDSRRERPFAGDVLAPVPGFSLDLELITSVNGTF